MNIIHKKANGEQYDTANNRVFSALGYFSMRKNIYIALMVLVANLANTKWCKLPVKWLKPWHMGIPPRVLSI